MRTRLRREYRVVLLVLIFSLVRGVVYAAIIPPWQAPDEPRHFEHVRLVYEKGRAVSGADLSLPVQQEIISSMDRFNYWPLGHLIHPRFEPGALPESFDDIWFPGQYDPNRPNMAHQVHQPPLYYLLVGLSMRVLGIHDVTMQLYAGRLMSVIFATFVVFISYLTVRELFPQTYDLQIAVPTFIVLLPMHTFVTSAVMNDVLAELLVSILIYLLTVMLVKGLTVSRVGLVLVTLLLGQFTKRTFLIAFPLTLLAATLLGAIRFTKRETWVRIGAATAILIPVFGGLAWWRRPIIASWWEQLASPYLGDLSLASVIEEFLAHMDRYLWPFFKSFWGWFGWLKVELNPAWYMVFLLLCVAAGLGAIQFLWRGLSGSGDLRPRQSAVLLFYGIAVISVTLANIITAILGNLGTIWVVFLPQGRYLFPLIIPIAILFMLGLREWVPLRHLWSWLVASLVFFLFFDTVALIGYMIPYFYG